MLTSACLNPSSVLYCTQLTKMYILLHEVPLKLAVSSLPVPLLPAFAIQILGLASPSSVRGFQPAVVVCNFSAFCTLRFGTGIFLRYTQSTFHNFSLDF